MSMRYNIFLVSVLFLLILAASLHSGYMIGSSVENSTELESELHEVEQNYTENRENISTESYSELDGSDNQYVRVLEKQYYRTIVKPMYSFAGFLLDASETVVKGTARATYRYL